MSGRVRGTLQVRPRQIPEAVGWLVCPMSRDASTPKNRETQPLLNPRPIATPNLDTERSNMHKSPSASAISPALVETRRKTMVSPDLESRFLGRTPSVDSPLRRRNSVSATEILGHPHRPLFERLLTHHQAVTNPNSPFDNQLIHGSASTFFVHKNTSGVLESNASVYSDDEQARRLVRINHMRPLRLIGHYQRLANWQDGYCHNVEKIKNRKLRQYYRDQNYLIERFCEIDEFLDSGQMHINMLSTYGGHEDLPEIPENVPVAHEMNRDENDSKQTTQLKSRFNDVPGNVQNEGAQFLGYDEEQDSQEVVLAILVNFVINFVLLIGKLVVAILTNSMSVVASLVDSILDFLSTFIIYIANRLSAVQTSTTKHSYPVGRSRLEPLGILIFSVIIIISFFQVGQESFRRIFLLPGSKVPVLIGLDAIGIMTLTIVAKVGCWVWCAKSKSSSVQALAQDAMTDIIFNMVSLLMPTLGHYFNIWWFDPAGALFLSVYIIISWSVTAYRHIDNLTGAAANPLDYKVILYLSFRFAELIKQITALKVYHVGDNLNVEIDLVFNIDDMNLTFKDCHDIAEALQYAVETLPTVERAYVHIDYMEGNFKGHLN